MAIRDDADRCSKDRTAVSLSMLCFFFTTWRSQTVYHLHIFSQMMVWEHRSAPVFSLIRSCPTSRRVIRKCSPKSSAWARNYRKRRLNSGQREILSANHGRKSSLSPDAFSRVNPFSRSARVKETQRWTARLRRSQCRQAKRTSVTRHIGISPPSREKAVTLRWPLSLRRERRRGSWARGWRSWRKRCVCVCFWMYHWSCEHLNLIYGMSVWFSAISLPRTWSILGWNSCSRDAAWLSTLHSAAEYSTLFPELLLYLCSSVSIMSPRPPLIFLISFRCSRAAALSPFSYTHTYTDALRKSKIKLKEGSSSAAKVGNFIHYIFLSGFGATATQKEL